MEVSYEQLTMPYPLLLLRNARSGAKKDCRKQLALADSTAALLFEPYAEALNTEVTVIGEVKNKDGGVAKYITNYLGVIDPVHKLHRETIARLIETPLPPDRASMTAFFDNSSDAWDLLSWNLLYEWFKWVFELYVYKVFSGGLVTFAHPEVDAVAYADASLTMLKRKDEPVLAMIAAGSLQVNRRSTPPPWQL